MAHNHRTHGVGCVAATTSAAEPTDNAQTGPPPSSPSAAGLALTPHELSFLRVVREHPGESSGKLATYWGHSKDRAVKTRQALTNRGFLEEKKVQGTTGRPYLLAHLTPTGRAALGLREVP